MRAILTKKDILIIDDFLSEKKLWTLNNLLEELPYIYKENEKFKVDVHLSFEENSKLLDHMTQDLSSELETSLKLSNKLYKSVIEISPMIWVMRLKKGYFSGTHIDDHSDWQAILYFEEGDDAETFGGNLYLYHTNETIKLVPKRNRLVIFPSKYAHEVSIYNWDKDRYSISIWYSLPENLEKNKNTFRNLYESNMKKKNFF